MIIAVIIAVIAISGLFTWSLARAASMGDAQLERLAREHTASHDDTDNANK